MAAEPAASGVASLLQEVVSRLGPRVPLCPVDFSCPFAVCDLSQPDSPIVDVSRPFELLTGYSRAEVIGRNCRFLQHPEGREDFQSRKLYTDLATVSVIRDALANNVTAQVCLINYRKGGHPFLNLLTVVRVGKHYALGFQIDAVDSPAALELPAVPQQTLGSVRVDYRVGPSIPSTVQQPQLNELGALVERFSSTTMAESDWCIENFYSHHSGCDVVLALSSNAAIAYASPSSSTVLGFFPSELVCTPFSALCHPSDVVDIFRAFATGAHSGSYNVVFRIRLKDGGFSWVDALVIPTRDAETSISYALLILRKHEVVSLPAQITPGYHEMAWAKVTPTGLILHISASIKDILLRRADDLQGTSIHAIASTNPPSDLTPSLAEASCGKSLSCSHLFLDKRNRRTPVNITMSPGDFVAPHMGTALRASFVLLCITRDKAVTLKSHLEHETGDAQSSRQECVSSSLSSGMPSLTAPRAWMNELRTLDMENGQLARQLNQMMAARRRHRRRKTAAGACQQCGKTDSPEWRRGPGGSNTLCNSCGIRWAKQDARTRNASTYRSGSDYSAGSASRQSDSTASASPGKAV